MAYSKQAWRDYDDTKTENQNRDRGAVVTPERLNHMETGIANSAERAELEQTKQDITSQLAHIVTDVTKYGAVRSKTVDSTTAFKQAVQATPVGGTLFVPDGDYLITDTIFIDKGINVEIKGDVYYGGTRDKSAFHFKRLQRRTINISRVQDISVAWHGWENPDYVGIEFENLIYCTMNINNVSNFTTGIRLTASGGLGVGHFFNTYNIVQLYNNKIQLEFYGDGVQSWINANTFNETVFTYDQSGIEFQTANVDRYCIKDTHVNGNEYPFDTNIFNRFRFDISRELGGTYTVLHVECVRTWTFNDYRVELVAGSNVKFAVLNNKDNHILEMVFNPIIEFYKVPENIAVTLINNENNGRSISSVYIKNSKPKMTLNEVFHTGDFHKRRREYLSQYHIYNGVYTLDINSTTLDENYMTYGDIPSYEGGSLISNGVLYLKNIKKGDVFKVNVSQLTSANPSITLKAWDSGNTLIHNLDSTGAKIIGADVYWDTTNKAFRQNVNGGELVFSINSNEVSMVSVIFTGSVKNVKISSNNENTIILNSIDSKKQTSNHHYVPNKPTLTQDFVIGEILMNEDVTSGEPIGWRLENNEGTLTWTAFGTH